MCVEFPMRGLSTTWMNDGDVYWNHFPVGVIQDLNIQHYCTICRCHSIYRDRDTCAKRTKDTQSAMQFCWRGTAAEEDNASVQAPSPVTCLIHSLLPKRHHVANVCCPGANYLRSHRSMTVWTTMERSSCKLDSDRIVATTKLGWLDKHDLRDVSEARHC